MQKKNKLDMIIVDDCCSVCPSYSNVFPGTPVKLDLYHACQRFVKTLPKSNVFTQQISKSFGLIFRTNGDVGVNRTLATPSPKIIEANLQMFIKKWEKHFSQASIDAITNLRKHILKGCCSYIPPGGGTQRNERLHKN